MIVGWWWEQQSHGVGDDINEPMEWRLGYNMEFPNKSRMMRERTKFLRKIGGIMIESRRNSRLPPCCTQLWPPLYPDRYSYIVKGSPGEPDSLFLTVSPKTSHSNRALITTICPLAAYICLKWQFLSPKKLTLVNASWVGKARGFFHYPSFPEEVPQDWL